MFLAGHCARTGASAPAWLSRTVVQAGGATVPLASSSSLPSCLNSNPNATTAIHKRMWQPPRNEWELETPAPWSPFDANKSQLKKSVYDALSKDFPTVLRILRACHTKGDFRDGIDMSLKVDLGSTRKTRVPPPSGSLIFPHRLDRKKTILAVIAYENQMEQLREAGADIVLTLEEFGEQQSTLKYDDLMVDNSNLPALKKKFGRTLRGKMPTKKNNMVADDLLESVKLYRDDVRWRCSKVGAINTKVGQLRFSDAENVRNMQAFLKSVKDRGPEDRKETFIEKVTLSTSMGPGISIEVNTLLDADPNDESLNAKDNALQFTPKRQLPEPRPWIPAQPKL